jgi:hypothetical protein
MRILLAALVLIVPAVAGAQSKRPHCKDAPPDSSPVTLAHPYRDCEVNTKAKQRGRDPQLQFSPVHMTRPPRNGCMQVQLEFVVDTLGNPETRTVRVVASDDDDLADAVLATVPNLHYSPARLEGQAVRQLVHYRRGVLVMTTMVVTRGGGGSPPPPPPSGALPRMTRC